MTAIAAPPRPVTSILVLATLEAKRLLLHPLFLVALALHVWFLVNATLITPEPTLQRISDSWSLLTGFYLGLAGFLVMYRLTRSTAPSRDVVDASPLDEQQRTLALCLVCVVPLALAILSGAWTMVAWEPGPGTERDFFDVLPRSDIWLYHGGLLLTAIGGPLLGVTVGRWWSWPMAGAVTAVILVAWSVSTGIKTTGFWTTLHHQAAPVTLMFTGADSEEQFRQAGSWAWRLPYVATLCALALTAALVHGTTGRRRTQLVRVLAALGALALTLLLLSTVFRGEGQLLWRAS